MARGPKQSRCIHQLPKELRFGAEKIFALREENDG
jgi:hypothetical protein